MSSATEAACVALHCTVALCLTTNKESPLDKRIVQSKNTIHICTRTFYETLKTKWVKRQEKRFEVGWSVIWGAIQDRYPYNRQMQEAVTPSQWFSLRYATWPLDVQWNPCWPPVFTFRATQLIHVANWRKSRGAVEIKLCDSQLCKRTVQSAVSHPARFR